MGSGPAIRSSEKQLFTIKILCRSEKEIQGIENLLNRRKDALSLVEIRQLSADRKMREPYDLELDVACTGSNEAVRISDQVRGLLGSAVLRGLEIQSPPAPAHKWGHYRLEFRCLEEEITEAKRVIASAGFRNVKVLGPSSPMTLGVLWHTNFTREAADEWIHEFYIRNKGVLISASIRDAGILDRLFLKG
ncbi:MAG: hypothetical protein KGH78_05135 [Candidatus Micrarchaeota archaeon]|nr:hypothetical protein [Candidatus Micrarchaeota archaeon]